ncbi:MAG: C40 family peptidase [Saprospiraceae bacterium]
MNDSQPADSCLKICFLFLFHSACFLLPTTTLLANKNPAKQPFLQAPSTKNLREDIVEFAQNFQGLKYRYAGVSPYTGFDCSGFTSYVLGQYDIQISPGSQTQATQGIKISMDEVLPGDLVFFGRRGRITHVAMVVERNAEGVFCVHSTSSRGVVTENITTSSYWSPKIMFAADVISARASDYCIAHATETIITCSRRPVYDAFCDDDIQLPVLNEDTYCELVSL